MPLSAPVRAALATVCALPITLLVAGCQEDPQPLFDEDGTWVLQYFKLEDGDEIGGFGATARVGKFMINYDTDKKIVAAATCNDSMGDQSVTSSQCDVHTNPDGVYYCRCFSYQYELTEMTWTEFVPDGQPAPPTPTAADIEAGALEPGTGIRIALEEYQGYSNTYRYEPLPFGLFDSNGVSSEYVFQQRGKAEFEPTGCNAICGIGDAAAQ